MSTTKSASPLLRTLLRPSSGPTSRYTCAPCLRQQHQQQQRTIHKTKDASIPKPTPFVPDVKTFLTLIGRGLSAQASKISSWNKLFTLSSEELKELGVEPARTRRYLLRWRQKFRNGEYGVGGDFKFVKDGAAQLRVVELPSNTTQGSEGSPEYVSVTRTPGKTKLVLNVPEDFDPLNIQKLLQPGQSTADLKKPKDYSLKRGHIIAGPYATPVAGGGSSTVRVQVKEGMWEDPLGKKVFGGERRRAQTLHKLGVAEHRKAIGTAR
ncbi:telomere length regulation protein [Lithohypha guttulata]|nr:telomere length regulation protein [Lithohypha guttulata]